MKNIIDLIAITVINCCPGIWTESLDMTPEHCQNIILRAQYLDQNVLQKYIFNKFQSVMLKLKDKNSVCMPKVWEYNIISQSKI